MDEEDYEAQRQANIKANLELMRELGLYQGSSSLFQTPKKASIAAKAKPKPASKSVSADAEEYESSAARVQRPRRITRSVSRTLDSPQKPKGRGMKRALSDNAVYPAKVSRSRIDKYSAESDSDDDYHSHRRPSRTSHNTLNPARHYRSSSELQRSADRLGVRIHNPKTFGAIPGIPIGTLWSKRIDCSTDAVHAPTVAGISGNEHLGCWSICLSGGYEDDIDLGETFTYTGSGGRDLKGTKQNPKNLRTARQSSDQKWEGKNAALQKSVKTGKVVRVVRGWKAGGRYAPREGASYIIITDDEDEPHPIVISSSSSSCASEAEVEETLMTLEVESPREGQLTESAVRRSARQGRKRLTLDWGRRQSFGQGGEKDW
ncbi:YDG domain-containing protein [Pseudozyma hubeiensis]|nr:YDG domain-containing protein [Pseudozyma hubeiensis]